MGLDTSKRGHCANSHKKLRYKTVTCLFPLCVFLFLVGGHRYCCMPIALMSVLCPKSLRCRRLARWRAAARAVSVSRGLAVHRSFAPAEDEERPKALCGAESSVDEWTKALTNCWTDIC